MGANFRGQVKGKPVFNGYYIFFHESVHLLHFGCQQMVPLFSRECPMS
ncbi:hypothetical protein T4A_4326 [Trichinella pseudospiralis]|uniref:Uncharacterized protein n=1 Tax=Trichinella pseudospiralis TaxID=6337 RepID=A0A0V1DM31_TRIPS|nr:hypothetical protein T4A_4326 [Trichinella pseudospiralis]